MRLLFWFKWKCCGKMPNTEIMASGSMTVPKVLEINLNIDFQKTSSFGQSQKMWDRVPGSASHLSQWGSMSDLNFASFTLDQCSLWTTLNWITRCLWHIEDEWMFFNIDSHTSSEIPIDVPLPTIFSREPEAPYYEYSLHYIFYQWPPWSLDSLLEQSQEVTQVVMRGSD